MSDAVPKVDKELPPSSSSSSPKANVLRRKSMTNSSSNENGVGSGEGSNWVSGWWAAKRQSCQSQRNGSSWITSTNDVHASTAASKSMGGASTAMTNGHAKPSLDDKVRVGSTNTTVSILQGPHNHAIWKARLLCAMNAEDESVYAAATGGLRFDSGTQDEGGRQAKEQQSHVNAVEEAQKDVPLTPLPFEYEESTSRRQKGAHARAVAMITSTLPDETFAMVVNQNVDAFKLMEALDARFRPYPRYSGARQ